MEESDWERLSFILEGRVEPRLVEQNELKDNGIVEDSVEGDIIEVGRDGVSQRPTCKYSHNVLTE